MYHIVGTSPVPNSRLMFGFNRREKRFYPYADSRENQSYDTLEEVKEDMKFALNKGYDYLINIRIVDENYVQVY